MKIRNLAISGVLTKEITDRVCQIVGDCNEDGEGFCTEPEHKWFFDRGGENAFMNDWQDQEEQSNFKNCIQMTYSEFLNKYTKVIKFEL